MNQTPTNRGSVPPLGTTGRRHPGLTRRHLLLLACVCGFQLSTHSAGAATLNVPGDYVTIQAAIEASASGDIIQVAPGIYDENINARGKALILRGADATSTVIDGGARGHVCYLDGGSTIQGFTIQNGRASHGGGIIVEGPGPNVVRNNIIRNNRAGSFDEGQGGGIFLDQGAQATIESNFIEDNLSGLSGGGVQDYSGELSNTIKNNTIRRNGAYGGGGGVVLRGAELAFNLISENWAGISAAGLSVEFGVARNNTIVGNINQSGFRSYAAGIEISGGSALNNIVVGNQGPLNRGVGIVCGGDGDEVIVRCNDSWGNNGGDYLIGACTLADNISVDPLFCEAGVEFQLSPGSPCAPANSGACGLIGAMPVAPECQGTRSHRSGTWGQLKVLYR